MCFSILYQFKVILNCKVVVVVVVVVNFFLFFYCVGFVLSWVETGRVGTCSWVQFWSSW